MLSYHVQYPDRATGGICETYTVAQIDGILTVSLIGIEYGRPVPISQTTGRWSFYAGGTCLESFDLDATRRAVSAA